MSRPLKKGMDYFPHDTDASNDEKIEALRALHGNDGYAFYFILLERIYRTANAELDISKPAVRAALIAKIGVSQDKFEGMLQTAFDIECLNREAYEEYQVLTSKGIKRRAAEVQGMRERWRKRKENPGDESEVFGVENPVENSGEISEETPERKEKKSKEKKSKDLNTPPGSPPKIKYAENVSMTEEEHQKLVSEFGDQDAERMIAILDNYKGSKGKRYKSDYRAILSWVVNRLKEEKSRAPTSNGNHIPRAFASLISLDEELTRKEREPN